MRWRLFMGLALLSTMLLSGCDALLAPFMGGASTPEQAVQQSVPAELRHTLQILGRREAPGRRVVIVYRTMQPGPEGQALTMLWSALAEPDNFGWENPSGSAYSLPLHPDPEQFITTGSGSTTVDEGVMSIAYGVVLSPEVAEVEVTFDNGEIICDRPENDIYAAASHANTVCLIRALDESGAELSRSAFDVPPLPDGDEGADPPDNCARVNP